MSRPVHFAVCHDCRMAIGPLSKDRALQKVLEHYNISQLTDKGKITHAAYLFTFDPFEGIGSASKYANVTDWHWVEFP